MADYYAKCNLPKQAISYYIKSIDAKKEQAADANVDTTKIQGKIIAIQRM